MLKSFHSSILLAFQMINCASNNAVINRVIEYYLVAYEEDYQFLSK